MHHNKLHPLGAAATLALALGSAMVSPGLAIAVGADDTTTMAAAGKQLAFDRTKGNCLACHSIEGGEAPGNIGPALTGMAVRYPDKAKLRAQIWDATVANPETAMPPFGRYQILSEQEIDQLVEFIRSK